MAREHGACWRCRYFDKDPEDPEEGGFCRRYPPQMVGDYPFYPGVDYIDWCGEFREEATDGGQEAR